MNEALRVYGFDARTPLERPDPDWTQERRAGYLIRPDVARPLSVDRTVWPPVPAAAEAEGGARDYWADLAALRAACASAALDEASYTLIALAVAESSPAASALATSECSPEIDPSWEPLGYDVADTGLTSALSNSGFVPRLEDPNELRRRWGALLNAHGLFERYDDAAAFRRFADARAPEHAPFLVHRLYRIRPTP